MKRIISSSVAFLFLACAIPINYFVKVNSLATPEAAGKKKFVLLPGIEGVGAEDLQFREFARYVSTALQSKGYSEAATVGEADVAVIMNYGIGAPQETVLARTRLIYGETGGGTSTIHISSFGADGYSTTTGTVSTPSTYGVVGTATDTTVQVMYFRYLLLDAVDLHEFRKSETILPVWRTAITSEGSSDDLRHILPVLVAASLPYLTSDSREQMAVRLSSTDPRIQFIKSPQPPRQ